MADDLERAIGLQLQVERNLAAEGEALERLNQARAEAYLAPTDKAAVRALSEAEQTLAKARETAVAARAAAGRIDASHHKAIASLEQHDMQAAELARQIEGIRTARTLLVARDSLKAAHSFLTSTVMIEGGQAEELDALGQALIGLTAAVPDEAGRLSDEWGNALRNASDRLNRKLAPALQVFVRGGGVI